MSKRKKREKNLLDRFKDIDNETLLSYLTQEIPKYIVLEKSAEMAKQILAKYNIATPNINECLFNRYNRLLELAKLRNIAIPASCYEVEVTNIDVISRIDEYRHEETRWVDDHNYLFDLYQGPESFHLESEIKDINTAEVTLCSDKQIDMITQKYHEIIVKEFDVETRQVYDKKRNEYFSRSFENIYKESVSIQQLPKILMRK